MDFCPHRGAASVMGYWQEGLLVCVTMVKMGADGKDQRNASAAYKRLSLAWKSYAVEERYGFILRCGRGDQSQADNRPLIPHLAWAVSSSGAYGGACII